MKTHQEQLVLERPPPCKPASGWGHDPPSSEEVLFEVEMEDMREAVPKVLEGLAEQERETYRNSLGETQDSVTGEILEPGKVKEG